MTTSSLAMSMEAYWGSAVHPRLRSRRKRHFHPRHLRHERMTCVLVGVMLTQDSSHLSSLRQHQAWNPRSKCQKGHLALIDGTWQEEVEAGAFGDQNLRSLSS